MINISCKFYLQKNDGTYVYCINLVYATTRHKTLLLTCIQLLTVALSYHLIMCENYQSQEQFSPLTGTNVSWKMKRPRRLWMNSKIYRTSKSKKVNKLWRELSNQHKLKFKNKRLNLKTKSLFERKRSIQ